jgi:peptidoglycan hydrolase CwlO-like protein
MKKLIAVIAVLFFTSCENKSIEEGLANLNKALTQLEADFAAIDINATLAELDRITSTVEEMEQENAQVNELINQVREELTNLKLQIDEFDMSGTNEKLVELKEKLVKAREALDLLSLLMDFDLDGVVNAYDLCPDTPPGAQVNLDGCAEGQTPA